MKIDAALILSAGKGTRMGPVGQVLPKVLWPVFDKTLLEIQYLYAQKLGVKNIFANTHFKSDLIENYVKNKSLKIHLLNEPNLLDVGGAIHNLKRKAESNPKSLLVLNGDVINLLPFKMIEEAAETLNSCDVVLFGLKTNKNEMYNQLVVENNHLRGITPPKNNQEGLTYSGVSLINLHNLKDVEGASPFFESVANVNKKRVIVLTPERRDYYDFGTTKRYFETLFEILHSGNQSSIYNFLMDIHAIRSELISINNDSYNSKSPATINLSASNLELISPHRKVILEKTTIRIDSPGVYCGNLFSPVE